MKSLFFALMTLLLAATGCIKDRDPVTGESGDSFRPDLRIRDIDFADRTFFFVDSIYQAQFECSLDSSTMSLRLDSTLFLRELDVWMSVNTIHPDSVVYRGVAAWHPGAVGDAAAAVPGKVEHALFVPLQAGRDFEYDAARGYFALKTGPAAVNRIVGVSYRNGRGQVGTLARDFAGQAPDSVVIRIKLIQPLANVPVYPGWQLTMRNVYDLGRRGISPENFDMRVFLITEGGPVETDSLYGASFLYLLGLDRLDAAGRVVAGGDGEIDRQQSFIFDFVNGYLIFPSLTPFDPREKFGFSGKYHVNAYQTTNTTQLIAESKFEIAIQWD